MCICRPHTNKLYTRTCNEINVDFIEANNKLEKCLGYTNSPRILFLSAIPAVYDHQTLGGVTEEEVVSRNKENFVPEVEGQSEVPSEGFCGYTKLYQELSWRQEDDFKYWR
jgi:hypothetical protein